VDHLVILTSKALQKTLLLRYAPMLKLWCKHKLRRKRCAFVLKVS